MQSWISGHDARNGLREQARTTERQRAHHDRALRDAAQRCDVGHGVPDLGQGALQAQGKRCARRCRHHAACRSLEQRDTDAVLEVAHCDAHGRLRDAQAFGNRRHVVLVGERHKRTNASLVGQHAEYRGIAHAALLDQGGELCASALHFGVYPPGAHEEGATAFGQEHSPRTALEQLDAELVLELVDGARNRGRRAKQGGAGPIRAALIGNREESSQVAQLGLHLFHSLQPIGMAVVYRPCGPPISIFDTFSLD